MHPNLRRIQLAGIESFKSVIDIAKAALNTALIVNGGSAVAMLAFCGAVISKDRSVTPMIVIAMGMFALGVLSAALASGFAYFAQHREHWGNEAGSSRWRTACITLVAVSYGAFAIGCATAGVGLCSMSSQAPTNAATSIATPQSPTSTPNH
ncbi:hypothetical protein FHW12_003144 [Dokdonella fugitiva]|uniref:Uncharacterized protein n=1 Tax=Dokdonella fugitiva TaxID=328517 RepID=A0A839F5T5_9GAMM|nr:hypothetical protein [Dokdonella fugitiva]MBA8888908.1 hypothetical protein [Dokdonella fugitiva]